MYNATVDKKENITNTVETKQYVKQPKQEDGPQEKTNPKSDKPNFVTIFLKDENEQAYDNILSAPDWLFEVLAKNESTANMVDLTKYLLYKATGDTQFWDSKTKFDFSIYDPDNFVINI